MPESRTGEVTERVSFEGEVLLPLDEAALRQTIRELAADNVRSIAVCLLFSFLAPRHEERARAIIAEEIPGCSVSLSSEIVPQIREYYRLSTTVINAYLQPILARYIANLDARLTGVGLATPQKYIMQSNGGMSTFAAAAKKAVATVLSGPAGGITASVQACRTTGFQNLITFDMGGTSCDVALIKDGEPTVSNRGKIEGRDISLPMIDINTVSAGGGTLARVDRFGVLEVGPQSAGAVPGPACYGRGGCEPTITDCNLVLGYLGEDNFLGGKMRLDSGAARAAIADHVARPLGIDVVDAAEGIVRIINVKMQEAIKAISTMRGHDLRDFHAARLRRRRTSPRRPHRRGPWHGRISCRSIPASIRRWACLMSDVKHDYIRSRLTRARKLTRATSMPFLPRRRASAEAELRAEGFAREEIAIEAALDMRYAGQGYEMTIACDAAAPKGALAGLRESFDAEHKQMFGHAAPDETVEIVSYRLRGIGRVRPVKLPRFEPTGAPFCDACASGARRASMA